MRVVIDGVHQAGITFLLHLIVIDWIWKFLEKNISGEIQPSWEDTIIGLLLSAYITWILI